MNAELHEEFGQVRRLSLRIQATPQATPEIKREVQVIAERLKPVESKLNAKSGSVQEAFVTAQLTQIKADLHSLFGEKLNPLMGVSSSKAND